MEHIPNLIGTVGATTSIPQIGYMLDPAHHGQGLATEALTAFLPVFFGCLPQIDYCEAWVNGENVKSLRVLEKCGFLPKTPNPRGTWEEGNAEPEENEVEEMAISNLDEAVERELRLAIEDMNLTVGKVYKAPLRKPMVGYELRKDNFTPKDEITKEKED
jgi:RimJ/RimL family protein N-acetyltransferase